MTTRSEPYDTSQEWRPSQGEGGATAPIFSRRLVTAVCAVTHKKGLLLRAEQGALKGMNRMGLREKGNLNPWVLKKLQGKHRVVIAACKHLWGGGWVFPPISRGMQKNFTEWVKAQLFLDIRKLHRIPPEKGGERRIACGKAETVPARTRTGKQTEPVEAMNAKRGQRRKETPQR